MVHTNTRNMSIPGHYLFNIYALRNINENLADGIFFGNLLNPRKVAEDLLNFAKSGHTAKDRVHNVT